MRSNVILCVLNRIFPVKDEEGKSALPKEESYDFPPLGRSFSGIQANEAPVKALIQKAHDRGDDINEIIYLCSNQCSERAIPISAVSCLSAFRKYDSEYISVEEFFVERISEYCSENGAATPAFNPLPYTPTRPADCITALNEYLDETYELSIDITGGRRDAVILQTLAVQLLKMRSPQNIIGDVIYSSYFDKEITLQNTTFSLIELIEAVSAFTNYGRADRLNAYFEKQKLVTDETRSLCQKMVAFSDALAVCQVGDIDEKAKAVQKAMSDVDAAVNKRCEYYSLATDAINALDEPDGWACELTPEETLENIRQSDLKVNVDVDSPEELRSNLAQAQWDYTVFRGELLLHSLIPTMREKFIHETDNNADLIINIINWCVDHQMVQQAMCIYREKISECLLSAGLFKATSHFNNIGVERQKELIVDLAFKCCVGSDDKYPYKTIYFYRNPKYGDDYNDYFLINEDTSNQLHSAISWYKYLHGTRNMIMHVDSTQDALPYKFACIYLGKRIDGSIDIAELEKDIRSALECIKKPMQFDRISWNSSYKAAMSKRSGKAKKAPQPAYSSKDEETNSAVKDIMALKLLLLKFAGNEREINFADFENWCESEEKKTLDKTALGLDVNIPAYEGICKKFGKPFSWRKDGNVIYLKFR